MYTIYPIDAGAAFVTPATPAFSHHYDTGFTKTFVGRYLQVSPGIYDTGSLITMIQVSEKHLSPDISRYLQVPMIQVLSPL